MKKVELLLIGAGRSGTTTLSNYLRQHPQIDFSSIKEVHYFSIDDLFKRGEQYYHSFFNGDKNQKRTSADTYLLIDKKAPERIKEYNPDMKFIVLLRHPVDRAYSAYQYALNYGYEDGKASFPDTINLEGKRMQNRDIAYQNNMLHFYGSLYYRHISFWMEYFDRSQFLLLTSDELKIKLKETLQKISTFAGIEDFNQLPDETISNAAAQPRSKAIQQFLLNRNHPLRKAVRWLILPFRNLIIKSGIVDVVYKLNKKQVAYPPLELEERREAQKYFEKDLQLLKKDLNINFE